jgi:hypothetical protein
LKRSNNEKKDTGDRRLTFYPTSTNVSKRGHSSSLKLSKRTHQKNPHSKKRRYRRRAMCRHHLFLLLLFLLLLLR